MDDATFYQADITLNARISQANVSDGAFFGTFYQSQVYNRALSPTEIKQNFNALRGRYRL